MGRRFRLARSSSLAREGGELTTTGDLVGTLRYMAPEQASGKRDVIDHRCDIYSLGATLFEALTGRPAFVETQREALLRLIGEGCFDPPSRHDASIPVALETIVLKAMERDPSHRYATAAELGDDLERFLDGRPIAARRRTRLDHALDWAARHRRLVAASLSGLVFVAATSVAVAAVIWHERNEKAFALEQAQLQSQRAEAHFVEALDGATRLLTRLEEPKWNSLSGIAELRNEGLAFFRQFVHAESADPRVRFESARACRRMASVYCAEQDAAHAQEALRLEFTLLDRLVADEPNEPAYRDELAGGHFQLATLQVSLQRHEAARGSSAKPGTNGEDRPSKIRPPSASIAMLGSWPIVPTSHSAMHGKPRRSRSRYPRRRCKRQSLEHTRRRAVSSRRVEHGQAVAAKIDGVAPRRGSVRLVFSGDDRRPRWQARCRGAMVHSIRRLDGRASAARARRSPIQGRGGASSRPSAVPAHSVIDL